MAKQSKATADPLIERWTNVERVLAAMPEHDREKHWNMATWGEKTECGTVACAAGHCGLDPWFRRRGFKMDFVPCDGSCGNPDCDVVDTRIPGIDKFFGELGAGTIFFKSTPRPVSQVIKEVRAHIKT